ncbi:MAG: hypothetical protein MUF21_08530 [Gemmatimonadaceae bacterium]|jgi:hypothetical protein|nr:hypothetical protein [Gemmatimonadaceae bacterium]
MSPFTPLSTRLVLRRVRKTLVAGHGACRIRVTVLHDCSLALAAGEALAVGGPLPIARSMLCAIAAGVARADSGRAAWSPAPVTALRYAPIGDAPRVLRCPPPDEQPGLVILDEALGLGDHAPPPVDTPALVTLIRPWLERGGAVLLSARVSASAWPWRRAELVGGALVPCAATPAPAVATPARRAPTELRARAVAESGDATSPWLQ